MNNSLIAKIDQSPTTAGVYVMRNKDSDVVYVGKSINLRKRLYQHAASLKTGWSDRNHRWIYQVADVSWFETGSELYALLLEDHWIKKYWPLGNVRQKDFLEYAYLAFSVEPLPRLLVITAQQREPFKDIFGPFRNIFYAQDMADLVQARFRLRTCAALREGGCLQWEIRKCSGPCRDQKAASRYLHNIDRAIASLRSHDMYFIRFITNLIERCSQKREYEKAAHYHGMLHRYQGFIKRQQFLAWFRHHSCIIRENGDWQNTFYFLQGRLIEHHGVQVSSQPLCKALDRDFCQSEWQIIDRANVIYQWLHSRRSESEVAIMEKRFLLNFLQTEEGTTQG